MQTYYEHEMRILGIWTEKQLRRFVYISDAIDLHFRPLTGHMACTEIRLRSRDGEEYEKTVKAVEELAADIKRVRRDAELLRVVETKDAATPGEK